MDVGEEWAYRPKRVNPIAWAEVLAVGSDRPARVKIRLLADEYEGRTVWVPPSQLKCKRDGLAAFLAREAFWDEVVTPFKSHNDGDDGGSQWVFDEYIPDRIASRLSGRRDGVVVVCSWGELETLTGPIRDAVKILSLREESDVEYVPWPGAITIAAAFVARHPLDVAGSLDEMMEAAQRADSHGRYVPGRGGEPDRYVGPPRRPFHVLAVAPSFETVRGWLDEPARREVEESFRLRRRLDAATGVMNNAIQALVNAGQAELAWPMHHWLYPEATKLKWRSVANLEKEAREAAWKEWLPELRRNARDEAIRHQVINSRLYGAGPPKWAWSDPDE